jgi:hypothetical protein
MKIVLFAEKYYNRAVDIHDSIKERHNKGLHDTEVLEKQYYRLIDKAKFFLDLAKKEFKPKGGN